MSDLFLDSLELSNFRAFRDLKIAQLGRVNLIVGKNSVGKTSLLESLWLYANQGSPEALREILHARNEYTDRRSGTARTGEDEGALASSIKYLFNGRKELPHLSDVIKVGPSAQPAKTLILGVGWYTIQQEDGGIRNLKFVSPENALLMDTAFMALSIQLGEQLHRTIRLDRLDRFSTPRHDGDTMALNNLIRANGLPETDVSRLWNKITLTDLEDDVVKALKIIVPQLDRVAVLSDLTRTEPYTAIARIRGSDDRIPLRSLGDGINRIFGITLALVNCRNGFLLIDEIENGLHYTVQLGLWRIIFEIASRLNVQVFCTTHNWDCIEAFQKASVENQSAQGMLIRLDQRDNAIVATLYDERLLSIATREQLEVR